MGNLLQAKTILQSDPNTSLWSRPVGRMECVIVHDLFFLTRDRDLRPTVPAGDRPP